MLVALMDGNRDFLLRVHSWRSPETVGVSLCSVKASRSIHGENLADDLTIYTGYSVLCGGHSAIAAFNDPSLGLDWCGRLTKLSSSTTAEAARITEAVRVLATLLSHYAIIPTSTPVHSSEVTCLPLPIPQRKILGTWQTGRLRRARP